MKYVVGEIAQWTGDYKIVLITEIKGQEVYGSCGEYCNTKYVNSFVTYFLFPIEVQS